MSRDDTGALQLERLNGLKVGMLRELTDVDTYDDALRVAAAAPATAFARLFAQYAAAVSSSQVYRRLNDERAGLRWT